MLDNLFQKASRLKLRYETTKGNLSIEDLWDLPLSTTTNKVNLDSIAKDLYFQLKNEPDVSFVVKEKKSDEVIQLKFDIVKYIIDTKLAEREANSKIQENKEKKQQLLAIIAQKKNEVLSNSSLEDLEKMANAL
jgi:hypothetical protein